MRVTFVRSGSGARARIQEWRSTATGRVHEVLEPQSYAPAVRLEEGAIGWLVYAGGTPWVEQTKDAATRAAAREPTRRPTPRPVPRRPLRTRGRTPWALIVMTVLIAVIVGALLR